jgi:hypothetical protein
VVVDGDCRFQSVLLYQSAGGPVGKYLIGFFLISPSLVFTGVTGMQGGLKAESTVARWNNATLQAAQHAKLAAQMASRALAIVHTCMYDAWAAYDEEAVATQLSGALRRPIGERTQSNKDRAISYAAFRALSDVLPVDTESVYKPLMRQLGYDLNDKSTDIETPAGIGNVACAAVLEFRHQDQANQLGNMLRRERPASEGGPRRATQDSDSKVAIGPYADWSGYDPVNPPGTVPVRFPFAKPVNPDRWQPLTYTDSTGNLVLQMFSGAQWRFVVPFALGSGEELRGTVEPGPAKYGTPEYEEQSREVIDLSANLTDRQKTIAEYWSDGPNAEQTLGHWFRFGEFVSKRDHHSLDDDVKMYFAMSNAMLDASIAAWDAKRMYDSVRPVTAIALLFQSKAIRAWGGPGKGAVEMDGSHWTPYQLATSPTPPCPEYVSEVSSSSAAAAHILELWTGGGRFGDSEEFAAGSSRIEPGVTPAKPVRLKWERFADAANEAGMSGRYGGIQFARGDLAGRKLGRAVADLVWAKAQSYFAKSPQHR